MIYLILFSALVLRLIKINQSLWLDEAINVNFAKDLFFWDFVTKYPIGDFHPPGYFAILWGWSHIFGFSEIAVRMPSVILGLGTIWVVYLIGKLLVSSKFGIMAAIFLAVNPLHIYYSQEARMYSMSAFAAAFATYCLCKLIKNGGRWIFVYGISIGFLLFSDYLAYFLIPAHLVYIVWSERQKCKDFFIGMFFGGLFIVPWLFVFPNQLESGKTTAENVPGWKKVVGSSSFKNLGLVFVKSVIGRISLDNKQLYFFILAPIGLFYSFLIYHTTRKLDKNAKLFISWVFLPVILAFIISFFIPILSYFRMIFILPGLMLLITLGIEKLPKVTKNLAIAIILVISLISLIIFWTNPKFQREDWKGVKDFINNNSNAVVLFEDAHIPAPVQYYVDDSTNLIPGIKNFPVNSKNDLVDINRVLGDQKTVYLVDYLVEISDPNRLIDRELISLGWQVVNVYNFNGVGLIYEYSKSN